MKKIRFIFLTAVVFFLISPQNLFSQEERIKGLIAKMSDETLRSSFQGEKYIFNFNSPKPNIIRYHVTRIPGGLEKKAIISLDTNKTLRIILKDSKNLWEYIPSQKKVIKTAVDPAEDRTYTLIKNLDLVKENYSISIAGEDILVADRKSTLVEFVPKNEEKRPRYKLWIDQEKGIALRTEIYSPKNRLTLLAFYSKIAFDIPQNKERFVLRVPKSTSLRAIKTGKDLELISLESLVDFKTMLPKYLPKGFVLTGGRVKTYKTSQEIHVHYSDGLSGVSLFENSSGKLYTKKHTPIKSVPIKNKNGNFYIVGMIRILEWQTRGVTLALVGELPEEEFLKIARSIE
jgi:outer membrane lipoprotein-sorting protein